MQVSLSLSPGYRLKISRASRMSELVDRAITRLAALGGSAPFLEILRRWLQRRQEKRQEQLQLDVRILEEGHALRQEAYQREREALQVLAEERERRHKACAWLSSFRSRRGSTVQARCEPLGYRLRYRYPSGICIHMPTIFLVVPPSGRHSIHERLHHRWRRWRRLGGFTYFLLYRVRRRAVHRWRAHQDLRVPWLPSQQKNHCRGSRSC